MNFLGFTVMETIGIITFLSGLIFSGMKFYHLFAKMLDTLESLKVAINSITTQNADHENRITRLEEKVIGIFKKIN